MKGLIILSVSLLFALTACGTVQISIDSSPTPDVSAIGTMAALQVKNQLLETQVAALSQPTQVPQATPMSPTATPTAVSIAAMRITFLNGATVGSVSAPIQPGETRTYVLQAAEGQPMYVYVGSPNNDVTVAVQRKDGLSLLSANKRQTSWQGTVPLNDDYYVTVYAGSLPENFSLTVTLPSRIRFAQGADSATVSGQTVGGFGVSYAVLASQGQTMRVDLGNLTGKASISIYGFTDGQGYVLSAKGKTSYQFVLPSTQDYIIVVVPANSEVVNYSLVVKIQ